MCVFNNIKLKYRQVVKYTTNFIRCKGAIMEYKEGPKHVVYYCSFKSNKVCYVFDDLPIFNLIRRRSSGDQPRGLVVRVSDY